MSVVLFCPFLMKRITSFQYTLFTKLKNLRTFETRCHLYFGTSVNCHSSEAVTLSYSSYIPEIPTSQVPVIILHGLLGSKQNWRGLARAISLKTKRKVFALDARNHGDSPHTKESSYPLMSEDVKRFMNSQDILEAVIIGHSMGGRTAMHFAFVNEPLVNKLVVVDISPGKMPQRSELSIDYMKSMKEALGAVSRILNLGQARKVIDDYLSKSIPEVEIRQFLLTNLAVKDEGLVWKANLDVLVKTFHSGILEFPSPSTHFLKETVFICGGDSPFVKYEDYPFIKSLFPKADIITISGAGHWVHSEKPSEFLEAVYNFL